MGGSEPRETRFGRVMGQYTLGLSEGDFVAEV